LSASANICEHATPCLACVLHGRATNSLKLALTHDMSNSVVQTSWKPSKLPTESFIR